MASWAEDGTGIVRASYSDLGEGCRTSPRQVMRVVKRLVEGGWIRDSGARRPSLSGQEPIVWELARPFPTEEAA